MSRSLRTAGCCLLLLSPFAQKIQAADFQLKDQTVIGTVAEADGPEQDRELIPGSYDNIYGGKAAYDEEAPEILIHTASARNNTLDTRNKAVSASHWIIGGYAYARVSRTFAAAEGAERQAAAYANGNTVHLSGERSPFAYGGYGRITIDAPEQAAGGAGWTGKVHADKNTVFNTGAADYLYGGYADASYTGSFAAATAGGAIEAHADGNTAGSTGSLTELYGGSVQADYWVSYTDVRADIAGSLHNAYANGNSVTHEQGSAEKVQGGQTEASYIYNYSRDEAQDDAVKVAGGMSEGHACRNIVTLNDSSSDNAAGGEVLADDQYSAALGLTVKDARTLAFAKGNTVTLNKAHVAETLYGGTPAQASISLETRPAAGLKPVRTAIP